MSLRRCIFAISIKLGRRHSAYCSHAVYQANGKIWIISGADETKQRVAKTRVWVCQGGYDNDTIGSSIMVSSPGKGGRIVWDMMRLLMYVPAGQLSRGRAKSV
jgi:hypothetical protein